MNFFNLHTHQFSNQPAVLELVNQYPWEFNEAIPVYSIGIHPWHINEERLEQDLALIEEKLQTSNCLALGECGLDKRIDIPFSVQQMVFEKQIALAEKFQKPLILHCVAAFQEVIEIKNRLQITVPMVIHGFSKNEQLAKQLLENGFYLSFGKYLIRNPALKTVFQAVPNDRFFLETDTIEETIEEVYFLASNYKNWNIVKMKTNIAANFENVFSRSLGISTREKSQN